MQLGNNGGWILLFNGTERVAAVRYGAAQSERVILYLHARLASERLEQSERLMIDTGTPREMHALKANPVATRC